MNNFMNDYVSDSFAIGLKNLIIALIVLLIGWIVAKALGNIAEKAFRKTKVDERFFTKIRKDGKPIDTNKIIGKVVYYFLLVVTFVLFFNILNLDMIANPLSDMIHTILNFIPAVLKAALILLFAWLIATAVEWFIIKISSKFNLNHLFFKIKLRRTEVEVQEYVVRFAKVIFYVILLLFIPGVLDALNIQGVSGPFSSLIAVILSFIPKLLAAALIFAVGWFIATIIRKIVVNLLEVAGIEKVVSRLKLENIFEGTSFVKFVGNLVFILIMIPITIGSLEKLDLTGISTPAIHMLNDIMNMVPNILIAIGLILVGIWLGKLIGGFVKDYLGRLGFNGLVAKFDNTDSNSQRMSPSHIVGYIVQVLVIFFLTVQALYLVKLDFLVGIATAITAYLPNILAAVLIIGVAVILANIVHKVLSNILVGEAASLLAGLSKYAILVISVFMALTQLGIAKGIVTTAFTLILGGLALAFGLAFGLGGKDFAQKYLQKFDRSIEDIKVKEREPKHSEPKQSETHIEKPISEDKSSDSGHDPYSL